jgi:hypothetical protein
VKPCLGCPSQRLFTSSHHSPSIGIGRAEKGESGISLDCIGYILPEKTGGVNVRAKKEPCERDPLRELQVVQQLTKLSYASGSPPSLIGIT